MRWKHIHSLNNSLLSTYFLPDTILCPRISNLILVIQLLKERRKGQEIISRKFEVVVTFGRGDRGGKGEEDPGRCKGRLTILGWVVAFLL